MPGFANIDGETLASVSLHVPNIGPWWADVVFVGAPDVPELVTLSLGELQLTGAVQEDHNGVFGEQRRARVVAGAGGWGALVPALHYHNDAGAGVRAQTIAADAATAAGETLGAFSVDAEHVGIDYVRQSGRASRVLEDVINGTPWHVDYSGATNVGARDSAEVNEADYQVIDFEPASGMLTLTVDDLSKVVVGSIVSESLDAPATITELRVNVTQDSVRVTAWTGGELATSRGRLADALLGIVSKATSDKLFAKYKYRLVQMNAERAELQAVSVAANLPDVLPVSMQPGVAGAHAKLTPGSIVLVEFVEGDRTQPIVVAFAGKDSEGHATDELDFSVTTVLRLGSDGATDAVALAPSINSQFDDINTALDLFVSTLPVINDGGAAIQTAVKGAWGTGAPPKPASDVGASKVVAE